jgi:hypothetical protein
MTLPPSRSAGRPLPRWFGASRDASIAFVERFHSRPVPETLFHYTSSAALISIITNNELWLSDATFLNDRVEITHGRAIACNRLAQAASAEDHAETRAMLEASLAKFEAGHDPPVYVVCFSFEADDLPQWRGYGGSEAPVAIEIEHGPLMFGYCSEGLLQQVLYESDDQVWTFDVVINAYRHAYKADVDTPLPGAPNRLSQEEERAVCAGSLYHALWRYIVACKDETFRSEREARFTYVAHDLSREDDWAPVHPKPRFRGVSGRIVPYLTSRTLNFENLEVVREAPRLPIRSIRIGPTADQPLAARGIRRLLDQHGHADAQITLSPSPFRPR